jgi:hypothetical protein
VVSAKNWLIIAHSFNADGKAASLTVTDKIPSLAGQGITVTVISAATGEKDTRFPHYQKLPWGPSGLRFDFRHIMQRRFGRGLIYRFSTLLASIILLPFVAIERVIFGLGNQASWALPAAAVGVRLARQHNIDLIYSSGGAASAHHAAALIKKRTGIPWIAEIHDPMVIRDDPADDGTAPRRTRNARYLQAMEQRICCEADAVWWFTATALEYARKRNPVLGDKGFFVHPGAIEPEVQALHAYGCHLSISHFGAITDDRSLWPLVRAISSLAGDHPAILDDVRIHAWGSALDSNTRDALQETGLENIVILHDRVPREESTIRMFETDCLLLLHGDYEWCAEYIPSKLYDYFWTRRPVLAITNRNPTLDELLTQHGSYVGHTFDEPSIRDAVMALWTDWKARELARGEAPPVTVDSAVSCILEKVHAI